MMGSAVLPTTTSFSVQLSQVTSTSRQTLGAPRFMANSDETPSKNTITSGRKEIAYDEATGRFFETGLDDTECVPEEEFCMTDDTSGDLIRLTVEEKERIFLDSLQVSREKVSAINIIPCTPY